jgi:hypothetical protein
MIIANLEPVPVAAAKPITHPFEDIDIDVIFAIAPLSHPGDAARLRRRHPERPARLVT